MHGAEASSIIENAVNAGTISWSKHVINESMVDDGVTRADVRNALTDAERVVELDSIVRNTWAVTGRILNGKDYVVIVQIKQHEGNATVIVTSHTPER